MRLLMSVALVIASFSAPAIAADPAEDKVVCKRIYNNDTGSNFRRSTRTCMKKSEWKELAEQTDRTMRDLGQARPGRTPAAGMGSGPN